MSNPGVGSAEEPLVLEPGALPLGQVGDRAPMLARKLACLYIHT